MTGQPWEALRVACAKLGLDASRAELIRASENHLYRLPGQVVARVTRAGQLEAARKEIRVSGWLASSGVPVVVALSDIPQPLEVDGRAVTFWHELPQHRAGTLGELADLLKRLHTLTPPDFALPPLAPFHRLHERLTEAKSLPADDRAWLLDRLAELEAGYAAIPAGRPWCAVHGDAWSGNIAGTPAGPVLLDLERFAYGPPEWDLASIAVSFTTFGSLSAEQWQDFSDRYGYDVLAWEGFELLRDIRELRKVTFAWQLAETSAAIAEHARHRLACVRGGRGPRPWGWTGVPSPPLVSKNTAQ